jgi:hypothetical protein
LAAGFLCATPRDASSTCSSSFFRPGESLGELRGTPAGEIAHLPQPEERLPLVEGEGCTGGGARSRGAVCSEVGDCPNLPLPSVVVPSIGAPPPPLVTAPQPAKSETQNPVTRSGEIAWAGKLERNEVLIINGSHAAPNGTLTGELPGSPVEIKVAPETVKVQTSPNPATNFKVMVLSNRSESVSRITIRWDLK